MKRYRTAKKGSPSRKPSSNKQFQMLSLHATTEEMSGTGLRMTPHPGGGSRGGRGGGLSASVSRISKSMEKFTRSQILLRLGKSYVTESLGSATAKDEANLRLVKEKRWTKDSDEKMKVKKGLRINGKKLTIFDDIALVVAVALPIRGYRRFSGSRRSQRANHPRRNVTCPRIL